MRIFVCTWSLQMPGVTRTCFVVSSSEVIVSDCSDSEFDGQSEDSPVTVTVFDNSTQEDSDVIGRSFFG